MEKMVVVHFDKMSVRVPIVNNESVEEIEDRLIQAVDSIGPGVCMSFKIVLEEYDD